MLTIGILKTGAPLLTIGILNSMPEAAVRSTERQFNELLVDAAMDVSLDIRWFSLQNAREGYGSLHDLWSTPHLDGLIATGTEPRAANLSDEPYWDIFTKTIDWATTHTNSTIWSCLSAHAAVLHLDGIQRCPFAAKLHGVFISTKQEQHPLLNATEPFWGVPHSRWNDLPLEALLARGYQVLTHAPEAGADLFVKTFHKSLFVFFQGHPEYDARALMREYRRDVLRFLSNERATYPGLPANYFDYVTEYHLRELRAQAIATREPRIMGDMEGVVGKADLTATWQSAAVQIYRNWFNILVAERAKSMAQVAS